MLINIKGCYSILGVIVSDLINHRLQFSVPLKDKPPVIVEIDPAKKSIEAFHQFEVSKKMWDILQTDICDSKDFHEELQTELSEMKTNISQATRKVLSLIKYFFNQKDINEELLGTSGAFWSRDKVKWKRVPTSLYGIMSIHYPINLNEKNAKAIQEYLDDDQEPFFALRHLHKAKKENNPRYKWIDATIAAELAIKEFLIRLKPDIETLLLEVPSPPLHKLYGSVLESFTNQRSPKLKELQKGAKIRNKLLHKPIGEDIDLGKANKYVRDVEIAIYHLLTLLYPKEPIIKTLYNRG